MKKLILAAILVAATPVFAGQVMVADKVGAIPTTQVDAMRLNGSRYNFDVQVIVNSYASKANLDRAVSNCIKSPNMVCIGLDPTHHATNVHFGTGLGVDPANFNSISAAGNPNFKNGDWAGGVVAIADATMMSRTVPVAPPVYQPPVQVQYQPAQTTVPAPIQTVPVQPASSGIPTGTPVANSVQQSSGHPFLWFLFFVALIGVAAYLVYRFFFSSPGYTSSAWSTAPASPGFSPQNFPISKPHYPPPTAAAPVVINNGGGSNLGNALIAGAAGYELGKLNAEVENNRSHRHSDDYPAPSAPVNDGGGSSSGWDPPAPVSNPNDGGGSSSSWDSSPSSDSGGGSSSWDSGSSSGGGSSSWDSGGSSGGSFDSGGGGGSFDSGGSSGGGDSSW